MSANIAIVSAAANLLAALLKKQADSDSAKEAGAAPAAAPEPVPVSLPGRHLLGQFSTRNESFFKHIVEIDALVHHYVARPSVRKPLCFLISAPPGSGKSFLVKQLLARKASGGTSVPFLELNVANASSPAELDPVWSFVRTMEANRITPCVFFDEIDVKVGDRYILKDLIMPMYDGAVFYQGAKLSLGPVIFVFAGSKLFEPPEGDNPLAETGTSEKKMSPTQFSVSFDRWRVAKEKRIRAIGTQPSQQARKSRAGDASGASEIENVPKIRDFLDRIDRCIVFPDPDVMFDGMTADVKELENVDLVLGMIHMHFPHIIAVEPAAAWALAKPLIGASSKRAAERLVFTSSPSATATVLKFSDIPPDARTLISSEERSRYDKTFSGKTFKAE